MGGEIQLTSTSTKDNNVLLIIDVNDKNILNFKKIIIIIRLSRWNRDHYQLAGGFYSCQVKKEMYLNMKNRRRVLFASNRIGW